MKTTRTGIVAAIVATSAIFSLQTTAFAADKTDLMRGHSANWEGFYAGIHTGWNNSRGKDRTSGTKINNKSFDGGIHAGYNWQTGGTVMGFEMDANFLGISKKNAVGVFRETYFSPFATTRLRVGQSFGDSLLYGTAGLSFGVGSHKTGTGKKGKIHPGWVIGAGLEHKLTDSWSLRGEYLYHNFGKKKYKFSTGTRSISYNDTHNVRLGISYHF